MPTADIVIVGGGVIGTSTAFQLGRRRAGRVVLLERATVGAGPTAKTIGIIRLHYSYEPLIRLAVRGLELFSRFEALTGFPADFTRTGFLLLATPAQLPAVEENVALQRRLGVQTSILSPAEVARLDPRMNLEDVEGAAYEPEAGYADGYAAAAGFAAAARRLGVEIWEGTRAERLVIDRGAVRGVETTRGMIEAGTVLVAAGAHTAALLAAAGVAVPIQASRQQ
ncbi:MAG: FAD-dependent oxidoreductase, partial [Armatimonadota bacterium]|nr:FAD-dependent oxidoreductase [Armatimonadota bacterium]